jgi:hypothetical protein
VPWCAKKTNTPTEHPHPPHTPYRSTPSPSRSLHRVVHHSSTSILCLRHRWLHRFRIGQLRNYMVKGIFNVFADCRMVCGYCTVKLIFITLQYCCDRMQFFIRRFGFCFGFFYRKYFFADMRCYTIIFQYDRDRTHIFERAT